MALVQIVPREARIWTVEVDGRAYGDYFDADRWRAELIAEVFSFLDDNAIEYVFECRDKGQLEPVCPRCGGFTYAKSDYHS